MCAKIKIKTLTFVLGIFCISGVLTANETANAKHFALETLFSPDTIRDLLQNGKIQRSFYGEKNVQLKLSPKTDLGDLAAKYWNREKDPVFLVESLYIMPKKQTDSVSADADIIKNLSLILRNLSKMTGMEYFSTSRQRREVLYTDVYTVNNPKNKTKIPDPVDAKADGLISYVYQKDRSLGGCVYQFSYFEKAGEISFRALNTEKIIYKGFSIVKPENLALSLVALDAGDSVVFYILVQADVSKIPILSERLARSYGSRADAIYEWCAKMYMEEK